MPAYLSPSLKYHRQFLGNQTRPFLLPYTPKFHLKNVFVNMQLSRNGSPFAMQRRREKKKNSHLSRHDVSSTPKKAQKLLHIFFLCTKLSHPGLVSAALPPHPQPPSHTHSHSHTPWTKCSRLAPDSHYALSQGEVCVITQKVCIITSNLCHVLQLPNFSFPLKLIFFFNQAKQCNRGCCQGRFLITGVLYVNVTSNKTSAKVLTTGICHFLTNQGFFNLIFVMIKVK